MKKNSILILLIAVVLQSCAVKQQQKSSADISGHWILKDINGTAVKVSGRMPGLEFVPAENKVFGFGGCNQISGPAEVKDSTIKFGALISTKMACPSLETETDFLRIISDSEMNFRIQGRKLSLSSGQDTLTFEKGS